MGYESGVKGFGCVADLILCGSELIPLAVGKIKEGFGRFAKSSINHFIPTLLSFGKLKNGAAPNGIFICPFVHDQFFIIGTNIALATEFV
jgi:hypothetical protein